MQAPCEMHDGPVHDSAIYWACEHRSTGSLIATSTGVELGLACKSLRPREETALRQRDDGVGLTSKLLKDVDISRKNIAPGPLPPRLRLREVRVLNAHEHGGSGSKSPLFPVLASGASHQARDAFLLQGSAFAVCLDPACNAEIDTLPKCGPHAVIPRSNNHGR